MDLDMRVGKPETLSGFKDGFAAFPVRFYDTYIDCNCVLGSCLAFSNREWRMGEKEFKELLQAKLEVLYMSILDEHRRHNRLTLDEHSGKIDPGLDPREPDE